MMMIARFLKHPWLNQKGNYVILSELIELNKQNHRDNQNRHKILKKKKKLAHTHIQNNTKRKQQQ